MSQRHGRRDKPLKGTTRRIEEFVAALYPLMPSARSACGKTNVADPLYCHFVPEDTLKVYSLSYRREQKAHERRVEVQGEAASGKINSVRGFRTDRESTLGKPYESSGQTCTN
jgi:hypothetical protein